MTTHSKILKSRTNVWIFLVLALALRFVSDKARQPNVPRTLSGLQMALRTEPDAYLWHDLISDQYFSEGELKRSLFHRREAVYILDREKHELEEIVERSEETGTEG